MEKILRNKEIFEIIPFDYQQDILFFPVRHHSPACSYHLTKVMEEYEPDCILVEGPQNANHLVPVLTDEKTALPIAFYYFYKDTAHLISKEGDDYKCYYPFLNTSPEYNALMYAKKKNIHGEFIDLPFGEILIHTAENTGIRKEREIKNYNDDAYLSENKIFESICEKTGLRNFEEFWEKFFETDALFIDTESFVARMLSYCYLTRENTPVQNMQEDGCLVREQYMASQIRAAKQKYKRILVVTGGFHTYGLYQQVYQSKDIKEIKLHNFDEQTQNVYAMVYSYEAADALNGYASGMQNPAFYDAVWKELQTGTPPCDVYKTVVLDTLLKTAKAANKAKLLITMSDIASAVTMYDGLALLRGKKSAALYELYDSVQSCFIKCEVNVSSDLPLRLLSKIAMGTEVGKLCSHAEKVPLLVSFESLCEKYRLKINSVIEQKIDLDIFSKPQHKSVSQFFYQMTFLETGFCKLLKGSDIINNTDRSRIREQWSYKRSIQTDAALIDASVYGGTLSEVCTVLATRKLRDEQSCGNGAKLYVECFLMGVDISEGFAVKMDDIIINDGDFFSLGRGLYYFNMLEKLRTLYQQDYVSTAAFLVRTFDKVMTILPSMITVNAEHAQECIKICKTLYTLVCGDILGSEKQRLLDTLIMMCDAKNPEPSLYGAVLGLLYGYDTVYKTKIKQALNGYLTGSAETRQQGAVFLRGLFATARDIALVGNDFIVMVNQLVQALDFDAFLEVLPELRLAFNYFVPSETDDIAEKVAALYHTDKQDVKKRFDIYNELYAVGVQLEQEICGELPEEVDE